MNWRTSLKAFWWLLLPQRQEGQIVLQHVGNDQLIVLAIIEEIGGGEIFGQDGEANEGARVNKGTIDCSSPVLSLA